MNDKHAIHSSPTEFEHSVACRRGEHGVLRETTRWLREACAALAVPAATADRFDFCFNELLANVIEHGYADDAEHRVHIRLAAEANEATLTLRDDGLPFDVEHTDTYTPPATLLEAGGRGYGLHLVHSMVDGIHYARNDGWNEVTVTLRW